MMKLSKSFIAYYRVSTEDQGRSGLGLEAQKESCRDYISQNGILLGEFQDIESGASDTRVGINKAIQACKDHGATLVVKEISRISRGGYRVMLDLEEAGIHYIESTAPYDPSMVKGIKFIMAKEEREKISDRTMAALSVIKDNLDRNGVHVSKSGKNITSLGSPENLTDLSRERSAQVRSKMAREDLNNKRAGALIVALRGGGKSFYSITKQLNQSGFKTSRGNDFSEVQTKRLYERYK